jgi:hypothetical protein
LSGQEHRSEEALREARASLNKENKNVAKARHDVVDLAAFKAEKNDEIPPLTPEEEALLDEQVAAHPEDAPDPRTPVVTAFLVYVTREGVYMGTPDLNMLLAPDRLPTLDDMYAAVSVIKKDLAAIESAQQSVKYQAQMVQQMASQNAQRQQTQQILNTLPPNLRG